MSPLSGRRRSIVATLVTVPAWRLAVAPAFAQSPAWPARALRLVVPYPAGGPADAAARLLADKLHAASGQSVVIENRPGASGTTGMDVIAKAPGDGATLALSAISPLTLSPQLQRVPYDPLRDIAAAAQLMYSPVYLLATPAFPARSFAEAIAAARAHPGEVSFATSGTGSVGHIMLEQIARKSGTTFNHIPYKGGTQIVSDAVGGQFDLLTVNPSPGVAAQIAAGRLRVLAVAAPQRLPAVPDAPTLLELGHPDANLTSLFGIFAPGSTPPALIAAINATFNTLLADPEVQARLTALDDIVSPATPEAFRSRIEHESASNARIIKDAGIHAD